MPETQVDNTQVGAANANVPASNGTPNGSEEVANLKDIMGPIFGTTFKTDEDALRSIQEAKNMSGKVGQLEAQLKQLQVSANPSADIQKQIADLQTTLKNTTFFQDKPQFNSPEAKKLISAMGGDPEKVVESEAFKMAFEAIQKNNELEKKSSVLHSNPRVGAATDKITEAQTAMKEAYEAASKGDSATAQRAQKTAAQSAISAVIEAFEK